LNDVGVNAFREGMAGEDPTRLAGRRSAQCSPKLRTDRGALKQATTSLPNIATFKQTPGAVF